MQAVKNGIKSVVRTPFKTALFMLILAVLSALLSVALCVWSSVRGYLADCDEFYRTVAELEYFGAEYPSDVYYDASAKEALEQNRSAIEELTGAEGVIAFEPADTAFIVFDGYMRKDTLMNDPNAGVILVKIDMRLADGTYSGTVNKALYAREKVENRFVMINDDVALETGKRYLLSGHFFSGRNNYSWFNAEPMSCLYEGEEISVPAFTEHPGLEVEDGNSYVKLAAKLEQTNNCFRVTRTASLEDMVPFNQLEMTIKDGRAFTREEYDSQAKVLVIPDRLATFMGVKVGDKVEASLFMAGGDVYGSDPSEIGSGEYEVVGICDYSDRYPFHVFMPDSRAAERKLQYVTGYMVGSFRIKNGCGESIAEKAEMLSEQGFRLNVYDQGYSAASEPMEELQVISMAFLAVCAVFIFSALALYGHLFVSRQRDTAATMLALGSGKPHVFSYFVSACLTVALPSAIIGCFIGKRLEGRVMVFLTEFAEKLAEQDLRYSSSRITIVKTLAFSPDVQILIYVLAGALLVLAAALVTFVYTSGCLREKKNKKAKRSKKTAVRDVRSSHLSGLLKYSLLSIRRNVVRTLAVLLLCLVIAVFFGQLTSSLDGYREQLAAIKHDTVIKGRASDVKGHMIEGLLVGRRQIETAHEYEIFADINSTLRLGYVRFEGVYINTAGEEFDLPRIRLPESAFALETLADKMTYEPRLEQTESLVHSPKFYYADCREITWCEGYSDECFAIGYESRDQYPLCAVPKRIIEENGIELGDVVRFFFVVPSDFVFREIYLKVVASYIPASDAEVIYIGAERTLNAGYSSFTFRLADNSRLDELRQTLEDVGFKYIAPGERSANIVVIDDEMYLNITRSMERQIQYVSALYYSLYALAGIVGGVLAWLLVSSRRKEIANLRALGTQRARIIMNFLFEQLLLSAAGLLTGVLIQYIAGRPLNRLQVILTAAFFGVWCLSTLVSLIVNLSKQTMESLSEPE